MSGRKRWAKLRHHGTPTLSAKDEFERLKQQDRAMRWRRARARNAQTGQQSMSLAKPQLTAHAVNSKPDVNFRFARLCRVTVIELTAAARYRKVYATLQLRPPEHVPQKRSQQCCEDASRFLGKFGLEAERLGWSSADLFGLPPIPPKAAPWFNRMSRLDQQGLIWCLLGRRVVSLNETEVVIENKVTGSTTIFRRHKSAGPTGRFARKLRLMSR